MGFTVNKVIIIGRLGTDPKTGNTGGGSNYANLSIATSEKWTGKDGQKQERTEWHNVTVWGKTAENCGKYLTKGSEVYVEGKLQTRTWEKDGQKRYAKEVIAATVGFIGGNKSNETPQNLGTSDHPPEDASFSEADFGDFNPEGAGGDIPF